MKKDRSVLIVSTILAFLIGAVLLFSTEGLLKVLYYMAVSIFVVLGLCQLFVFVFSKQYKNNSYISLIVGICFLWGALFVSKYFDIFIEVLPAVFSLYSIILGIESLIKYSKENKLLGRGNIRHIIYAIVAFAIGVVLMIDLYLTTIVYLKVIGGYIMVSTLVVLIELIMDQTNSKTVNDSLIEVTINEEKEEKVVEKPSKKKKKSSKKD